MIWKKKENAEFSRAKKNVYKFNGFTLTLKLWPKNDKFKTEHAKDRYNRKKIRIKHKKTKMLARKVRAKDAFTSENKKSNQKKNGKLFLFLWLRNH